MNLKTKRKGKSNPDVKEAKEDDASRCMQFARNTNVEVIREIYLCYNPYLKIFWALIFATVLSLTVTMVGLEIKRFLASTVQVSVLTVEMKSIELPHMAICFGDGGLNRTRMEAEGVPKEIIAEIGIALPRQQESNDTLDQMLQDYLNSTGLKSFNNFLDRFSYTCNEVIKWHRLYYQNEVDVCGEGWILHHLNYYNCWAMGLANQSIPGVSGGAAIVITEPSETTKIGKPGGVAIELFNLEHQAGSAALLLGYGLMAHVAVYMKRVVRLKSLSWPKKQDRCSHPARKSGNCYYSCYNAETSKKCNCIFPGAQFDAVSDGPYCSPFTSVACDTNVSRKDVAKCQNRCTVPCTDTKYSASMTSIPYDDDPTDGKRTSELNIYYPALTYSLTVESDAYTWTNMISNIGGQCGLWLGCSVGTIIQAFVILLGVRRNPN